MALAAAPGSVRARGRGRALLDGTRAAWRPFARNPQAVVGLGILMTFVVVGIFAPWIAPYDPLVKHYAEGGVTLKRLLPPSPDHPFGTTLYGRDIFSQVVMGTRTALFVGIVTALVVSLVGLNVGLLAGYYGGGVDTVLMRITDIVYGVPILPFGIVALSILNRRGVWWIIGVMSILYWPTTARVIRSQVLSLRSRPFVDAARIAGSGHLRILYRHIAPNVLPQAFVHGVFAVAWAITTEASINFLGFGDPFTISWGTVIYDVFTSMVSYTAWWWFVPPGLCIMLVVTAFYFVGRAFEEVANPRLRAR
jgi:peptide/nickel transport system permease protein